MCGCVLFGVCVGVWCVCVCEGVGVCGGGCVCGVGVCGMGVCR